MGNDQVISSFGESKARNFREMLFGLNILMKAPKIFIRSLKDFVVKTPVVIVCR